MKVRVLKNSISGLVFVTVISQAIAFVRESIFAFYFGTSLESDAYIMACQVPVTLFAVISTSINTVIMPIFVEKKECSNIQEAKLFLKAIIIVFSILSFVIIIFAEIFTESVVRLFAPRFNIEALILTVRFTRILFPTVLASVIINITTVYYNAENHFFFPASIALLQNVCIILGMIAGADAIGVEAAVWGTFIGIFINMLLLLIPHLEILRLHVSFFKIKDDIKKVFVKVMPVGLGVGVAEINRIIDRAVASGLDIGSVASLNYASKLTVVFSSILLSAVTTVSFKSFSQLYVRKKRKERADELIRYLSLLIMFLLPVTIGAIILRKELIQIAFGRGAFDSNSVFRTSDVFLFSVLGIVFIAIREIISKFIYSSGDSKIPMINATIGIGINIILNLILSKYMGASGLALATTISHTVVCILLLTAIMKREKEFMVYDLIKNCFKISFAAFVMLLVLLPVNNSLNQAEIFLKVMIELCIGATVYLGALFMIDKEMLTSIVSILFKNINIK